MSATNVCLARFHDGSAKPNWGGRATSLALAGLVDRGAGYRLGSVLNGRLITRDIPETLRFAPSSSIAAQVLSQFGEQGRRRARPFEWGRKEQIFATLEDTARQLAAHPPGAELREIRDAIEAADEFWMNGEGDFILSPRRTLFRTLAYMQLALELGKPVRLVNSILSLPPARDSSAAVVAAVGRMLARCTSISYRDPESLRLHYELFPNLAASWTPDALFTWWRTGEKMLGWRAGDAYFGPAAEGLPVEVQGLLRDEAPIVLLSGSSSVRSMAEDSRVGDKPLRDLIEGVRSRGFVPVVAATCSGDNWMRRVAVQADCPFVPARVPLIAGMLLMSRSLCFASGRYHPSILASTVGAPVVLMSSNSHKNRSLQEVLGVPEPKEFPFVTQTTDVAPIVEAIVAAAGRSTATRASLRERMQRIERDVQAMIPTRPAELAA